MLSSRLKKVNNTVRTDSLDTVKVTACNAIVKVTKQLRLKPKNVTPVFVVSGDRYPLRFEPNKAIGQHHLLPTDEVILVVHNIPFCK